MFCEIRQHILVITSSLCFSVMKIGLRNRVITDRFHIAMAKSHWHSSNSSQVPEPFLPSHRQILRSVVISYHEKVFKQQSPPSFSSSSSLKSSNLPHPLQSDLLPISQKCASNVSAVTVTATPPQYTATGNSTVASTRSTAAAFPVM